jgi:oxygen-dependent protoporphyrinogen oxidase
VIGGGVSGLATARYLVRAMAQPGSESIDLTVLEAEPRLGGKVATVQIAGAAIDTGPDALLVRNPVVTALINDLGLDHLMRAPTPAGAFIFSRGRLRPLPAGSVFGVPNRLWPMLRSGLLGPWGFVRAGADLVLPRNEEPDDPTIEQLLRPRFGRQVFERLIEPMLGGVHAGRASRLSARSAVPDVLSLSAGHRSLFMALRQRKSPTGVKPGPALMTLDGGLNRLIDALRTEVETHSTAQILTGARVNSLVRDSSGWTIQLDGGTTIDADDIVFATPAWETARLLRPHSPAAASALETIEYTGVATVVLAYPGELSDHQQGTGFLVPPVEGRLLVACTWLSAKWPHLPGRKGHSEQPLTFLRCSVGRDGDQAWAELDDEHLLNAVRAELAVSMGVTGEPVACHIRRIPAAMPQYTVGHSNRLAAIDRALADLPGIRVTGAAYRGVGIAGCIAQAQAVAADVAARTLTEVSS